MKTLKRIVVALLLLIVVFVVIVITRPGAFRIERSAVVAAPPATVFPMINDFHQWEKWSPWDKLDPSMKRTYEGSPAGPGAIYTWAGNDKVGEGKMSIQDSKADEKVSIKLEFLKPFAATNLTTFTLVPAEGGTRVTWAMEGTNGFIGKAFGLFVNMDEMVGKDFEKGLASMSAAAKDGSGGK